MNCWCYSKERQRCDLPAGHEGDHSVSITWSDEDAWDPEMDAVTVWRDRAQASVISVTNTARPIPIIGYDDDGMDDLGAVAGGGCFSCGCSEDAHPCDPHGCRSFVA